MQWFLGGKGLDIQQGTIVWVGLPKSWFGCIASVAWVCGAWVNLYAFGRRKLNKLFYELITPSFVARLISNFKLVK